MNSINIRSLKISLILIFSFELTACSAYQEHFKCKAQPGLGCSSITEVNSLVNQGWPSNDVRKKEVDKKESFFSRLFKRKNANSSQSCSTCHSESIKGLSNPYRNTLRIWMAPYQDNNTYHDEQFVYSTIQSQAKSHQNIHLPQELL